MERIQRKLEFQEISQDLKVSCIQWNLYITDTLVKALLSIIRRCPLLGVWVWLIAKVDDVI